MQLTGIKILSFVLGFLWIPTVSLSLPNCPSDQTKRYQNCFGTYISTNDPGYKYVGEWTYGKFGGEGIKTHADGTVEEGIWKDNKFMPAKKFTPISKSTIEGYKNFCSEIGFTPGTEKFGECVVEAMKKG